VRSVLYSVISIILEIHFNFFICCLIQNEDDYISFPPIQPIICYALQRNPKKHTFGGNGWLLFIAERLGLGFGFCFPTRIINKERQQERE
jgi:hypothetical protein